MCRSAPNKRHHASAAQRRACLLQHAGVPCPPRIPLSRPPVKACSARVRWNSAPLVWSCARGRPLQSCIAATDLHRCDRNPSRRQPTKAVTTAHVPCERASTKSRWRLLLGMQALSFSLRTCCAQWRLCASTTAVEHRASSSETVGVEACRRCAGSSQLLHHATAAHRHPWLHAGGP